MKSLQNRRNLFKMMVSGVSDPSFTLSGGISSSDIMYFLVKSSKNHLGALDSRRLPRLLAVSQAPGKARRETPAFSSPRQGPRRDSQASCGFLSGRKMILMAAQGIIELAMVEYAGEIALYTETSVIARIICLKEDGLPGIASSIVQLQAGYQRLWVLV